MSEQILVEGQFGHGALDDRPDPRDFTWEELGADVPPFDWNTGFDVMDRLRTKLNDPSFKLPIKNQGKTYSCSGQAFSYLGEVLEALDSGTFEERSAKFIYAPIFIPNQGAYMRDAAELVTKQGWGKESLTPSYQFNMLPTEEFMDRPQDITDFARYDAKSAISRSYAYVDLNIDSVAQAIKANDGAIMLIRGENNGTWLTSNPKPGRPVWGHFLCLGAASLVNGVKTLHAIESWGENVGDHGWQYFGEEWFKKGLINKVLTHVYNPVPVVKFQHTFTKNLEYGQVDPEVVVLQKALQVMGYFPKNVPTSSHYGPVTRASVLKFQLANKIESVELLTQLNGMRIGLKSRTVLNRLFI